MSAIDTMKKNWDNVARYFAEGDVYRKLLLSLIALMLLPICNAAAEKRVALVIGNSAYQNVPRLSNPVNDATSIAATFRKAGFDSVEMKNDLSTVEMRRALRDFTFKTRDADIAVIYYAGHGIEMDGTNYLIPIDSLLENDSDVFDEAFSLDRVILAAEPAKQLRLIILDACRDNPFSKTIKRTIASRSVGRGLAKIEPTSPNTMIAFAAKAGSTASDGDSKNSPFAVAVAAYITKPGLDLRKAFGFVRDDVLKATGNKQEPFVYGSLGGNDLALVPAVAVAAASPPTAAADPNASLRRDYELALQIGTTDVWDSFIANYPSGFYTDLAKAQRGRLAAEKQKAADDAKVADAERGKIAALSKPADAKPADAKPADATPAAADVRLLQTELRRVGCNTGAVDGNWNATAQRTLDLFNKNAGTKLDVKVASLDALDAVKSKSARVCPLICEHGFKADGESCTKITCSAGFEVGDDNTCEKIEIRKPAARRAAPEPGQKSARENTRSQQSTGQIICNAGGCRPVQKGCRIEQGSGVLGRATQQSEICN